MEHAFGVVAIVTVGTLVPLGTARAILGLLISTLLDRRISSEKRTQDVSG